MSIPEDSALNWRVVHSFDSNNTGYIQKAYYATTGTTHLFDKATLLNGVMDHYHIDMNAIIDKDNDGIPDFIDNDIRIPTLPIGAMMLLLLGTP